jgi:hypothetical protein
VRSVSRAIWSGLFAIAAVGCYSPNPPLGIPCSSSQECPAGQECDLLTNVCGFPTEARALRDDTAAQFEGGTLVGAHIEPGGFVGPVPYFINGVRLTGIEGNRLAGVVDDVTFEELAQLPATGHSVTRGMDIDLGDGVPPFLGFTNDDDITVLIEGEILLDAAGMYQLELRANDIGFIDIAPPGGDFEREWSAGVDAETFPYMVTTPGWHRFRGAFADSLQFLQYELRYRPPGASSIRGIADDVIRVRVDGLDGAVLDGFDEPFAALHTITGLVDKLDGLAYSGSPFGAIGPGSYTMRWSAQFLVDTGGAYRFRIDTGQGHRAWIAGQEVANTYNGAALVTTTPVIQLEAGWHDVVIDTVKTGGPMLRSSFTVMEGPQFAGGGFPRDHLRPVAGRISRFNNAANFSDLDITDGMTVTRSIGNSLPAGISVLALDASFELAHPMLAQISVVLDPPAGNNVTLVAAASLTGTDEYAQHDAIPVDRAGQTFGFIVGDSTVDTMIGSLYWVSITTTYSGGRGVYESSATYTSTVREITAARLGPITWQMRQAKAVPIVSIRTCDEAAACEAEEWTPVAYDTTPTIPARRFFQYRVEIESSEDVPASLDWIDMQYVAYVEP